MNPLDDPSRGSEIAVLIKQKTALKRLYLEIYDHYADALGRSPSEGLALELGAGAGFAKEIVPELTTADILPYPTVDMVFDACQMPFESDSVRFICMLNVLHHIPDAARFFEECQRCLKPGGRILIVDQYPGWVSHWILKYGHHEPYNPQAIDWSFPSSGPLSGANGALAWIIFHRDRTLFERRFPRLKIDALRPQMPLRYWLSGGLKAWTLISGPFWNVASWTDAFLLRCSREWASFLEIELVKTSDEFVNELPQQPTSN